MFFKNWPVLLVDDDKDLLSISKLALKGIKCFGIPIKVHTCGNKAEAMRFLSDYQHEYGTFLSLAIIDVVMETEQAGLELCEYIRKDLNNKTTQLILRTAQVVIYPERESIDRYDISGYIAKVEATEERLYSIVKTALKQYMTGASFFGITQHMHALTVNSQSRESIRKFLKEMLENTATNTKGEELNVSPTDMCYILGDEVVGTGQYQDIASVLEEKERLHKIGVSKHIQGTHTKAIQTDDKLLLQLFGETDKSASVALLMNTNLEMPYEALYGWGMFMQSINNLWHRC